MVTQRKSIPLKRTMVTFSTSTEYHQVRSGSNKIAAQVHDRWCSCSMVCWVLRQTGSPTYPTKALASFWLMRGLMFGWEMCEEIPMAFIISSSRCIRISFGILGNLFFFFSLLLSTNTNFTVELYMKYFMYWTNFTDTYYMANPLLGKSLCFDWFFLGQDFAVRTVSM